MLWWKNRLVKYYFQKYPVKIILMGPLYLALENYKWVLRLNSLILHLHLQTPASHLVPLPVQAALLPIQIPGWDLRKQRRMAQILEPLNPYQKTRGSSFLWSLWPFGESTSGWRLLFSISPFLCNLPFIINK